MLTGFLRLMSRLPLSWLHAAGGLLGWVVYLSSPKYANRLRENLLLSRVATDEPRFQRLLHANIAQTGRAFAELPAVWFRSQTDAAALIRAVHGGELLEAAREAGRGLVLLTPHLGCFEILAQYCSLTAPLTILYRSPRIRALEAPMLAGRNRPNLVSASADLKGVRALLKALRRGEAVGILPDQVPGKGDGEWADFFGRPAYTMTLASRLQRTTGATVLLCYAVRLPRGQGFVATFREMPPMADGESSSRWLNRALEDAIRRHPDQYLWSYNRYKGPAARAAA